MKFHMEDKVEKFTGDYNAIGEIRSIYTTPEGKERYMVALTKITKGCIMHTLAPENIRFMGDTLYKNELGSGLANVVTKLNAKIEAMSTEIMNLKELIPGKSFRICELEAANHRLIEVNRRLKEEAAELNRRADELQQRLSKRLSTVREVHQLNAAITDARAIIARMGTAKDRLLAIQDESYVASPEAEQTASDS